MMPIREAKGIETELGVDLQEVGGVSSLERRSCHRCGGFLAQDWIVSLGNDGGDVEVLTHRCIQCGESFDPLVLRNRYSTIAQPRGKTKKKPRTLILAHNP
ncbi:MAG: hypothetical protein VST68_00665 [Nitrospirota bacterium]|nr:hypothetical protein [Nitrospirota bacterium]